MRALVALVALLFALTTLSGDSQAVDLKNLDERAYKVLVKSAGARRVIDVPPRSLQLIICPRRCSFSIRGYRKARSVSAIGEDTVTISKQRLKRLRAPSKAP